MHILFVTSYNFTTNPRLTKEVQLAIELGYEVDFIGFDMGGWSQEIEENWQKNLEVNQVYLSAQRRPFVYWLINSLVERFSRLIYPLFPKKKQVAAYAHSKRSRQLWRYLRKQNRKYDLVIAHNLAALYPAYRFAIKENIPFGFDVEDYHPGEAITKDVRNERRRRELLMKEILPQASYISVASPLIGEQVKKLIGLYPADRLVIINNVFPSEEFIFVPPSSGKVRFVWFSQNIASGRGLELILPVLEVFKQQVELHLIGNLYVDFYENVLKQYSDFVFIHRPLPQKQLHYKLGEFDIGLALEPGKDENNEIALSNKIWAYFQAGLFILATDTPAQKLFMEDFPDHLWLIPLSKEKIVPVITQLIKDIDIVRNRKKIRFEKARHYSWDVEKNKLKEIWQKVCEKC